MGSNSANKQLINMLKRYEYWGPNGKTWTRWFRCRTKAPSPMKGLKVEYKEEQD